MLRQLATIKDNDNVTGFIMHDGFSSFIMSRDDAELYASHGMVMSLYYRDGKFIPIIQGDEARELKKAHMLRKYKKAMASMTFDDYCDTDCLIRQWHINLLKDAGKPVIIGSVCNVMGRYNNISCGESILLTMGFYSSDIAAIQKLKSRLSAFGKQPKIKDYGNFILATVPFHSIRNDKLDLTTLENTSHYDIVYSLDGLATSDKRWNLLLSTAPCLNRLVLKLFRPDYQTLDIVHRELQYRTDSVRKSLEREL